ncbi:MAG: DUF1850 domain-containing protein [Desulfovibrio sp.]|nr:DUF1850 domain-containing protein [Desulfovibrio sp.]
MLKYNGAIGVILAVNLLLFYAALAFAEESVILSVSVPDGSEVLERPMKPGEGFAIRYTHSVALSPVTDYFVIENGDIYIDATVYEDFGAGLPHETFGDQKMKTEDGRIVLTGLKRKVSPLDLRVGRIANHTLILDDGEIPLKKLAKPGQTLTFKIIKKQD